MKSRLLLLAAISLSSGCAMIHQETHPIAGGQSVSVEVERMRPGFLSWGIIMKPARNAHAEVRWVMAIPPLLPATNGAQVVYSPTNAMQYLFALKLNAAALPVSVSVADVTDARPVVLVADSRPNAADWGGVSAILQLNQPNLAWLQSREDVVRIYCFTLVTSSGDSIQLYQAVNYSYHYTAFLRRYFARLPNPR